MRTKAPLAAAISLATAMTAPSTFAQDLVLEEVVVTARKKAESLIDVPMSISAVSGDDISKLNITDLENLQDSLPNLSIVSSALSAQRTYVRGQGSDTNQGFEQSVGWFVDGIYGGRGEQFKTPTFDVSSVELLRGPQGTVLGKNIIAGAINIRTARPTDEFDGHLSALYTDETGEQKYEAVVSGPLADGFRGRLALMSRSTDGWIENTASAAPDFGEDLGQQDDDVFRVSLEWDITENLMAFFKAETASAEIRGISNQVFVAPFSEAAAAVIAAEDDLKISDSSTVLAPCGDEALRTGILAAACERRGDNETFADVDSDNYVLEFTYDFGDYELVALSGWSEFDSERLIDSDYSNLTTLDNWQVQSFEQFSQEFRINSPGGETLDWTAGLYYQDNDYVTQNANILLLRPSIGLAVDSDRNFKQTSEALSAFGEVTFNATDELRFILGARWTEEEKEFTKDYGLLSPTTGEQFDAADGGLAALNVSVISGALGGAWATDAPNVINSRIFTEGDRKETETTLAGTVQYDLGDSQLYFNIAEGFKAGGFDEGGRKVETAQFEPEEALAFELGGKFTLAGGAANLNVAIFYVQYENLQVSVFDGTGFAVANAAESTSQGVEVDGRWLLAEGLSLGGAFAFLDSSFDEYSGGACTVLQEQVVGDDDGCDEEGGEIQDLTGEDTNFAPRLSGNLHIEYETPLSDNLVLSARADVSYRDEMFTQGDNDPIDQLDSFTKWDARLAVGSADDVWEVALIGKNLTDEMYALFSGDTPLTAGSHAGPAALPRTFSLQGTYRF